MLLKSPLNIPSIDCTDICYNDHHNGWSLKLEHLTNELSVFLPDLYCTYFVNLVEYTSGWANHGNAAIWWEGDGESIKRAVSDTEKLLTFLFSVYVWCKFFPFNSLTYLEVMISVKTLKSNAIKSHLLLSHLEINTFWCISCYFLPIIKNCCVSNCVWWWICGILLKWEQWVWCLLGSQMETWRGHVTMLQMSSCDVTVAISCNMKEEVPTFLF